MCILNSFLCKQSGQTVVNRNLARSPLLPTLAQTQGPLPYRLKSLAVVLEWTPRKVCWHLVGRTVTTRSQSGGLKRLLMEAKEESKDPGFKFNTQKTKIRESSPVTSWQTVETVADFNYLGSKITADSDCSHEGC